MNIRDFLKVSAVAISLAPSANANSKELEIPHILEITQDGCSAILGVNVHDVLMDIVYCSNDTTPIGDFVSTGKYESTNYGDIADRLRDIIFSDMSVGTEAEVSALGNLPAGSEYFGIDTYGKAYQIINGPIGTLESGGYNCTQKINNGKISVTCDATVDTSQIPGVLVDTCKADNVERSESIFYFLNDNPVKYIGNANTITCDIEQDGGSDYVIEDLNIINPNEFTTNSE